MAFRGMHPQDALHIVKQESHRYTYGTRRADTHAKQQSTIYTPGLEHVRLDTPHHSHLQQLPPIPSTTQPPQWMPEDRPYTDRDKQYHYHTPIQQLATTLGHPANTPSTPPSTTPPYARIAFQHTYKNPDSNSRSNSFPSSPDTTDGTHAARSTSPQDTPNAPVATRKKKPGTTSKAAPCTEDWTPSQTGTQPTTSHSTPDG